ncbi:MAG: mucoidy inhibitor MuiA family protein [Bacteroidia bacterium]|nr:mucoidy inhibitor MuiA family protein [Bacteroidia bacterium]MDW8416857.1 mucoidy inhibitor MuiA family protein [Bacteroidia bacterium]
MDTLVSLVLTLSHVTVYPRGGMYRYTGMLSAKKGLNTFVWEGLPQPTDPSSVRVSIPPSARGYITQTSVEPVAQPMGALPADVEQLRRRIDSLESIMAKLQHRIAVLALQEKTLSENIQLGGEEGQTSSLEVERYLSLIERRLSLILEERHPLEKRQKALSDTLSHLKQIYDSRLRGVQQKRSVLFISYYAPQPEILPVRVELSGPSASWELSYRIRVIPNEGKVVFQRWASVQNNSGEDWQDIQVVLSTGTPERSGQMPPFQPWYVDLLIPTMPTLKSAYARAEETKQGDFSTEETSSSTPDEPATEPATAGLSTPVFTDQTVSRTYDLGKQRIFAGARQSQFFLAADSMIGVLRFFVNAPAEEAAYLRAGLPLSAMKLWEPAPAVIEVDGQEVARIQWSPSLNEDTLWLDLGRSPFLQVKRTQLKDLKDVRSIGGTVHRYFTYNLRISHTYNAPVHLTIWERLPISRHSDIKVEVIDPAGGTVDTDRGQLSWQVTLMPGDTWTRTFRFLVKYPRQKTIIGL